MANQFGSFGAGVSPEAMQAIKEAIARRQQGGQTPALDQQSGASPTAAPLPPEPQGGVPVPQPQEAPQQGMPQTTNEEATLIIKAMADYLKRITPKEPTA